MARLRRSTKRWPRPSRGAEADSGAAGSAAAGHLARAGERSWLGWTAADPAKESLLVVVNDDTDNAQDLKLTGEIDGLQDLRTGKRLEVEKDGTVRLHLEAGDGTVLQMP